MEVELVLELVLETELETELVSALEWVEEELVLGCQGSLHCCCKLCLGRCCTDHHCHQKGRFHSYWHRPIYSSSMSRLLVGLVAESELV